MKHLFVALIFLVSVKSFGASEVIPAYLGEVLRAAKLAYADDLESKGLELQVTYDIDNLELEISTTKVFNKLDIQVSRGLAELSAIDRDGFALLVCHELGHHFGEKPFIVKDFSVEGSADFYATNVCLKRIFPFLKVDPEISFSKQVSKKCDSIETVVNSPLNCERTLRASQQVFGVFSMMTSHPKSNAAAFTNGTIIENGTEFVRDYPSLECRLVTWRNGVLFPSYKPALTERGCWWRKYRVSK
jgi:hypothetical protein